LTGKGLLLAENLLPVGLLLFVGEESEESLKGTDLKL
jgi:hypothetical protein